MVIKILTPDVIPISKSKITRRLNSIKSFNTFSIHKIYNHPRRIRISNISRVHSCHYGTASTSRCFTTSASTCFVPRSRFLETLETRCRSFIRDIRCVRHLPILYRGLPDMVKRAAFESLRGRRVKERMFDVITCTPVPVPPPRERCVDESRRCGPCDRFSEIRLSLAWRETRSRDCPRIRHRSVLVARVVCENCGNSAGPETRRKPVHRYVCALIIDIRRMTSTLVLALVLADTIRPAFAITFPAIIFSSSRHVSGKTNDKKMDCLVRLILLLRMYLVGYM